MTENEEISRIKYTICCPMCDLMPCVKGTDKCEAEMWQKRKEQEMTEKEQKAYDRGFEQGRIQGRVEAQTEKENADGCVNCEFEGQYEWMPPCSQCKNNMKNYWRRRKND